MHNKWPSKDFKPSCLTPDWPTHVTIIRKFEFMSTVNCHMKIV